MTVLVTGGAGFIGSRLALRLLERGRRVIALDNFDPYYDVGVKKRNIDQLRQADGDRGLLTLLEADIRDRGALDDAFARYSITHVAHLAAMGGVRYSVERAALYADVNINGTIQVLEAARRHGAAQVVQASTSNVYGETARVPFQEDDPAVHPLAPYPASKRAAELFAYSTHHLHKLNITVLRFFNVYGPDGRPDMMPLKVLDAIVSGTPVTVYGDGSLSRDWTYIDDVVDGVEAALQTPLGFRILNIGCGRPIPLVDFIHIDERLVGRPALIERVPTPPTEVPITYCDNTLARELLGFAPKVDLETGLARTWAWYQSLSVSDASVAADIAGGGNRSAQSSP